jgi:tRNA threonylcarbamoyl adenosine modification protein YeaZ
MIIAFESSGSVASVAVRHGGRIAWREAHGAKAAENSLPMAAEAMAELGTGLAELEAVAFGAGPGAFTGVRAACAVAQGLAYAREVPVFAVPSLMAVAQAASVDAKVTGTPQHKSTEALIKSPIDPQAKAASLWSWGLLRGRCPLNQCFLN